MASAREKRLTTKKANHDSNLETAVTNQSAKLIDLQRRVERLEGAILPKPQANNVLQPNMTLGKDERIIVEPPSWHTCSVCQKQFDSTKGTGGILNTLVDLKPYKPVAESREHMKAYKYCGMYCHEILEATLSANRGEINVKNAPLGRIPYAPEMKSGAVRAIVKLQEQEKKVTS